MGKITNAHLLMLLVLLQRALGGVGVGLLLRLADVLLVPDPLVAEPVRNLKYVKDITI
jgi:hypothetical protein